MPNTSSWLATFLDYELLHAKGVQVEDAWMPIAALPSKTGVEVASELGGRFLLRYLLQYQVGNFSSGSASLHYVTPTPYSPEETISYLALPSPTTPRTHVMVLDPSKIPTLLGPQRIRGAPGIQYILPLGFPVDAIVVPGVLGASWEIEVR